MPTSRGSVHHTVFQDLQALGKSIIQPRSCSRPCKTSRKHAEYKIANYFKAKYSVLFPYARTSFYALLKSLDLPPGSEILMTPFNISPMLHIVRQLGLKPAFIDINLTDFGPNYDCLEAALASKPGCFLLTYLFGSIPDIRLISHLCKQHQVFLIEDISQGIGGMCDNQYLGTFGDAAIFSSSITKYVDGYNGSFVLTNNDNLHRSLINFAATLTPPSLSRIRSIILKTLIWNLALSRYSFSLFTYPLLAILRSLDRRLFDKLTGPSIHSDFSMPLPSYYFEDISSIQVSTMVLQLNKLKALLDLRKDCASRLFQALSYPASYSITAIPHNAPSFPFSTFWQFVAFVGNTKEAQERLFAAGIETGITNLPDLASLCDVALANAQSLKSQYIFIPLHPHLKASDYSAMVKLLS
jgi:perosamine synthetase